MKSSVTRKPIPTALVKMWDHTQNFPLKPEQVTAGSGRRVWWQHYDEIGKQFHVWDATISNMCQSRKCPICLGKRIVPGINDLATRNTNVTKLWHPTLNQKLTPQMVTEHSNKKVWWRHYDRKSNQWHEWSARIAALTSKKPQKCAVCRGLQIQIGVNDLRTTHPELTLEWHSAKNKNLTPESITRGSEKEVWWRHYHHETQKWHEWHATPCNRTSKNPQGCAICDGKQIQVGVNDLASQYPHLMKEWDKDRNKHLNPRNLTKGSKEIVVWNHYNTNTRQWHAWPARINNRTSKSKSLCPFCAGQKVKVGYNDLGTINPRLSEEWNYIKNRGLTPQDVSAKSGLIVWWQHTDSKTGGLHEWAAQIASRSNSSGCPKCSRTGFDQTSKAHFYVLKSLSQNPNVIQFGISNRIQKRLRKHASQGFDSQEPLTLIPFKSGKDAMDMERELKHLMIDHVIPSCTDRGVRFDGSTESFLLEDADEDFLEEFNEIVGLI